jgi:hypothetical protein
MDKVQEHSDSMLYTVVRNIKILHMKAFLYKPRIKRARDRLSGLVVSVPEVRCYLKEKVAAPV